MCNFQRIISEQNKFGDDGVEETLLPIPNRKVKLYSADGTAWETVWESRTLPSEQKKSNVVALLFLRVQGVVSSELVEETLEGVSKFILKIH